MRKGRDVSLATREQDAKRRERLWNNWGALKSAARATHKDGAGGTAICICGADCGGSAACSMLRELMTLVHNIPTRRLPAEWRKVVAELRDAMG